MNRSRSAALRRARSRSNARKRPGINELWACVEALEQSDAGVLDFALELARASVATRAQIAGRCLEATREYQVLFAESERRTAAHKAKPKRGL